MLPLALALGTLVALVALAIATKAVDDWLTSRSRIKRRLSGP